MIIYRVILLLFISFLVSCDPSNKIPEEISKVPVAINVKRFDQKFLNINKSDLTKLKLEFPYLFNNKVQDTFWLIKSSDTLHVELVSEVKKVFPKTYDFDSIFTNFYKYLKFYYPQINEPEIVTLIGDVDYKNRIILTKQLLLLSLDSYLGVDHHFYVDIQKYISDDLKKENLIVDVALEYAKKIAVRSNSRDFLSQMILYGKRKYFVSRLLPNISKYNVL